MKIKLVSLLCLASIAVMAHADDPSMRAALQAKYDQCDAAMSKNDPHSFALIADMGRFVASDWKGMHKNYAQMVKEAELHSAKVQSVSFKTTVDSADMLQGIGKAAVTVSYTEVLKEKGGLVTYKGTYTSEHTWSSVGEDWKLIETRMTTNQVSRNGKMTINEGEKVLTDYDRQYGHSKPTSSSHRRHARSGRRIVS